MKKYKDCYFFKDGSGLISIDTPDGILPYGLVPSTCAFVSKADGAIEYIEDKDTHIRYYAAADYPYIQR